MNDEQQTIDEAPAVEVAEAKANQASDGADGGSPEASRVEDHDAASTPAASMEAEPTAAASTRLNASLFNKLGPVFLVDPADCAPYRGAPRAGYRFDELRDAELMNDIVAHGVLDAVVLLRHDADFGVLSGNRRLAVVRKLRADGYDIVLPARIAAFTELEAVAFATAQNIGRAAPSAMQLARSVAWALDEVEQSQAMLARALGMDEAKVSHLKLLATLPAWVRDIVTDPEALSENFAAVLAPGLGNATESRRMEKLAARLQAKNKTLAGPAAARYLRTGKLESAAHELRGPGGVRWGTIRQDLRGGIAVRLSPAWRKAKCDPADVHAILSKAVLELMTEGNRSTS